MAEVTTEPVEKPVLEPWHRKPVTRVVITGVGAVTPLGVGAEVLHERWAAGECALANGVGSCDGLDFETRLSRREARRTDRFAQLALVAAAEAIEQAGWSDGPPAPRDRVGCVIATGIGGLHTIEHELETLDRQGPARLSPLGATRLMPNAAAAAVAMRYELEGESFGINAACASGAQSIGVGLRMLRSGDFDAIVVGGAEARPAKLSKALFDVMGATSAAGICRPFDRRRDGFILSEGAAVLILEREDVARKRDAPILGELLSYGASSDTHSLVAPHPEGRGAIQAMRLALERGGLEPADVDYINAHGTSTLLNDQIETLAIKAVFGPRAWEIPISTVKSAIGHLQGAAGSTEAVATLLALRRREAPPTIGLEEPDEGLDLDYVPHRARRLPDPTERERLIGLSNSFGLGGHNAAVALASGPPPDAH